MIVRSLATFVVVGLISGLIFGYYLIDTKDVNQLVFTDGLSLTVVTEKFDFERGEDIKIKVVNSGTVPLFFSNSSNVLKITGLFGILIYLPAPTTTIIELGPREEVVFTWDQIKNDGDMALEGLYKIIASGMDKEGNIADTSITVTISR